MSNLGKPSIILSTVNSADDNVLIGGGDMGKLMRLMGWSKTPIGPVSGRSQSLRTMVGVVLRNKFPILV